MSRFVLLAIATTLTACVSVPIWSPDRHTADPSATVAVSRVRRYQQANGATLTVTTPAETADGGAP